MTVQQAWVEAQQILEDVHMNLTDLARIDTDEDACDEAYNKLNEVMGVLENHFNPDGTVGTPTICLDYTRDLVLTTVADANANE